MNSVRNIKCMILTFFAIDVFSPFFPRKTVRLIFEHLNLSHCVYGCCFFLGQLGNCKQILFSITYSSGQSVNTCIRCKFMLHLFTQTILLHCCNIKRNGVYSHANHIDIAPYSIINFM